MTSSWQPPQDSPITTPTPAKPFYKRWWFITLAIFVVLGVIGSFIPESSTDSNSNTSVDQTTTSTALSTTTTTEPIAPWSSLLSPDVDANEFVQSLCKPLEQDIDDMSDLVGERLALSEEPSKDSYASAEFLEEISWENDDVSYAIWVRGRQTKVVSNVLAESKAAEPRVEQLVELLREAWTTCEIETTIDELLNSAKTLDARLKTIKTQAQNKPWYPKGFDSFDSNVAYRFLKYGSEYKCSYYGAYCWGVEIVTFTGCNNLYAELTFFDSSDRNIGWTNDTATNVLPREKVVLIFDTYEDGADTGRLSEVSCY